MSFIFLIFSVTLRDSERGGWNTLGFLGLQRYNKKSKIANKNAQKNVTHF